jgi:type I restriction enzyme S subunit
MMSDDTKIKTMSFKTSSVPLGWKYLKTKELFKNSSFKNNLNEELLSVTQDKGVLPRKMLENRVVMPESGTKNYKLVNCGDFIISLRSFQGGIELSYYRGLVSPAYTVLSPINELHSPYFKYLFKSDEFISKLGSAVIGIRDGKQISFSVFSELNVLVPPLPEQRKIADILTSVDKAIEKTEAIIAQTETVKMGLMQQLLTKGIGHTRFKQTEIGEIPEEWDVIQLAEVISSLTAGVSVNSENREAQEGELGILKTSAITYGKFNPKESKVILKSELDRVTISPKKDHLIISRMNTPLLVGASVYIDKDYPNLFLPDRLWLAEVKRNDVWVKWFGYLLSSNKMRERISDIATGTSNSMKNISKKSFLSLNIFIPSIKEQKQISDILTSIDNKITIEQQKLTQLQTIKKGLMQVLLTGKVRVKVDQPEEVVQ